MWDRADRPQHGDRLRRREGDREPGDGVLSSVEAHDRASSVAWIGAVTEEALERLGRDLVATEAEHRGTLTEEASGDLGLSVVVLASRSRFQRRSSPTSRD